MTNRRGDILFIQALAAVPQSSLPVRQALPRPPSLCFLAAFLLSSLALSQEPPVGAPVPGARSVERRTPAEQGEDTLVPTVLEGFVLGPDGAPAEGAVVVSSAGGKAVTDDIGSFGLEVGIPLGAGSVRLTAVCRGVKSLVASSSVMLPATPGLVRAGSLLLTSTSCSPSWLPGQPGTNETVWALAVFDDGGGPELYAGGLFTDAGGMAANYIARWDGSSWSDVGGGMSFAVVALTVFDDGGGPALYAGGDFSGAGGGPANRIAKWDGSSWSALDSGMDAGAFGEGVLALAGDGFALYAGGDFTTAGGGREQHREVGHDPTRALLSAVRVRTRPRQSG